MFKLLTATALLLVLLPLPYSYADATTPYLLDRGNDGGARHFKIICRDGRISSARRYYQDHGDHKKDDNCYYDNAKQGFTCVKESLQQAAIYACQQ